MVLIVRLLIMSLAVIISSYILPGVLVDDFLTAIIVAALLAVLNVTVRPILVFLTIPITIVTLGIFLLVINALMVLLADEIIPGFEVENFWWALGFSIILYLVNSSLNLLNQNR